jgi:hypothetical protein
MASAAGRGWDVESKEAVCLSGDVEVKAVVIPLDVCSLPSPLSPGGSVFGDSCLAGARSRAESPTVSELQREVSRLCLRCRLEESKSENLSERLCEALVGKERAEAQLSLMRDFADAFSLFQQQQQAQMAQFHHQEHVPVVCLSSVSAPASLMSSSSSSVSPSQSSRVAYLECELASRDREVAALRESEACLRRAAEDAHVSAQSGLCALKAQMEESRRQRQAQLAEREAAVVEQRVRAEHSEAACASVRLELAACREREQSLVHESAQLRASLDRAQLELANIKLDLATRRSDEDDLIARLEQQALEQHHAPRKKGSVAVAPSLLDWGTSWLSTSSASATSST